MRWGWCCSELLTGQRPFHELNGLALAAASVQSSSLAWEFPADLDGALVRTIHSMTARQPDQRMQSMQAVVATLSGGAAVPVPWRPARQAPRWRRAALPALLAASALLVAAGVYFWPWTSTVGPALLAQAPYSTSREMAAGLAAAAPVRPSRQTGRSVQALQPHPDSRARTRRGNCLSMALMYAPPPPKRQSGRSLAAQGRGRRTAGDQERRPPGAGACRRRRGPGPRGQQRRRARPFLRMHCAWNRTMCSPCSAEPARC
ncbi:hypothetical protein LP419_09400 [Massilia sp. H-1]|nr:hypothetical protein LP419_09400 [Massilia sp. H-1]